MERGSHFAASRVQESPHAGEQLSRGRHDDDEEDEDDEATAR
jgi:hypothetical protein